MDLPLIQDILNNGIEHGKKTYKEELDFNDDLHYYKVKLSDKPELIDADKATEEYFKEKYTTIKAAFGLNQLAHAKLNGNKEVSGICKEYGIDTHIVPYVQRKMGFNNGEKVASPEVMPGYFTHFVSKTL